MKRFFVALVLSLSSLIAQANPSAFGLEFGKTTEKDFLATHHLKPSGVNKYSQGQMYEIPVSDLGFDGLKELTAVFDPKGNLVGVLATLDKFKFDTVNAMLGKKYHRVRSNIPFVGNKSVEYRSDDTKIMLDAPHMSFDMTLNYIADSLWKEYQTVSSQERNAKKEKEASQL